LNDYYRFLTIIKSNFAGNIEGSLFFDYISETFNELPKPSDKIALQKVYDYITKLNSTQELSLEFTP